MTPRARGEHAGDPGRAGWAPPARTRLVAIVGAGASGTLVAVNLLRRSSARVLLIDPSGHGRGVAYSTCDERHLLNVPARSMSALADEPEDLLRWCEGRGLDVGRDDFLPRRLYGDYLRDLLTRFDTAGRLRILRARVENIVEPPFHGGVRLQLGDGSELSADMAVLAVGHAPPEPLRAGRGPDRHGLVQDPWAPGALGRLAGARRVVLVGSGLTAVDVAMSLTAQSPDVRICAVSRHGARPRAHLPGPAREPRAIDAVPGRSLAQLAGVVAAELARDPDAWRQSIDGLRPISSEIWSSLSLKDRERFESDLRWWWDVHRHRLAPQVARRLDEMLTGERLTIRSGTVQSIGPHPEGRLLVQLAGGELLDADAVVNATGPARASSERANPLVRRLLRCGRARLDELGLGLATSADGALVNLEGGVSRRCFTLGPPRRGERFESTAIPEIRLQAAALAEVLAGDEKPLIPAAAARLSHVNSVNPIGY